MNRNKKPRILRPGEEADALPSLQEMVQHLGEVHNNAFAQFQVFRGKAAARLDTMYRVLKEIHPEFEELYTKMWNAIKVETTLMACEVARDAGDLDSYTALHKQQGELRDAAIRDDWLDLYTETVKETHNKINESNAANKKIKEEAKAKTLTLEKLEEELEEI